MRVALQPAFVLHRRPYRNTSLLVDVFTREYGRLTVVARGVRGPRSRLKGLLQPFSPLLLSWSSKGNLGNLVAAEEAGASVPIPPSRLLCGFYVNELLLRLLKPYDPYPATLFEAYQQTLQDLALAQFEEPALRLFEKCLLAEMGYGLILDSEAVLSNKPIDPQGLYRYVLDQGPVPFEQTGSGITISGSALLAFHRETLSEPAQWGEIKRLTRAALNVFLQGQPLKTRMLLRAEYQRRRNP